MVELLLLFKKKKQNNIGKTKSVYNKVQYSISIAHNLWFAFCKPKERLSLREKMIIFI